VAKTPERNRTVDLLHSERLGGNACLTRRVVIRETTDEKKSRSLQTRIKSGLAEPLNKLTSADPPRAWARILCPRDPHVFSSDYCAWPTRRRHFRYRFCKGVGRTTLIRNQTQRQRVIPVSWLVRELSSGEQGETKCAAFERMKKLPLISCIEQT